MNSIHINLTM